MFENSLSAAMSFFSLSLCCTLSSIPPLLCLMKSSSPLLSNSTFHPISPTNSPSLGTSQQSSFVNLPPLTTLPTTQTTSKIVAASFPNTNPFLLPKLSSHLSSQLSSHPTFLGMRMDGLPRPNHQYTPTPLNHPSKSITSIPHHPLKYLRHPRIKN